jgi:hypothetical protein
MTELHAFRLSLFKRRNVPSPGYLADLCAKRDEQWPDMHYCDECANLTSAGRCLSAAQGRVPGASKTAEAMRGVLLRCPWFDKQEK